MAHQGAVAALVASFGAYSKEVEDLHGPYELELLEAASACWVEKEKIVQVRGKFGLRTRQAVVTEPSFVDEAERQLLGGALADWQRKAESDVGAAALNTRIAERRLLHAAARLTKRAKEEPAALPAFLDECLGAVAGAGAPAQLVSPSAFMLLRDIALTVTQSYLEAIGGEPDGNLVRVLRRYAGKLPWSASMFQPAVSQAPALLLVLLEAQVQDGEAQGKAALLKGSVALSLQFKWSEDADNLPASQMKTAVLALLLSLAHQIGVAAQQDTLPVNEAITLIHSIIQVLQAIAAGMPEMTNTIMAAILQIILCLLLDITASNLAGILCMDKDVSLPLEQVELLSLAQLVWSRTGDSQCSVLAVKVAQQCDWQAALAAMTKPMQLRSALVMLALYKAGRDDVDPAASQGQRWIWDLLQGPVGSTLSTFPAEGITKAASPAHAHGQQQTVQEEGMEAAHMLCMAAAPAAREEVLALWAWLRTQWALGLLEAWAMASNAEAVGRANALLEGMQFFEQCIALLAAEQHEAAISVVLRFSVVANLMGRRFVSGKLMSMAGVLSQCLGSRSADDANRLMQPIVRAVTKDVQLGAKPATSSSTAKDADQAKSPRKEPAAVPSLTGTRVAWQWATLLCCTAVQTRLPSAALQLLNDLVQLLFYHTEHSIGDPVSDHAEGTATHMQEAIGAAVEILGPDAAQRLWVPLLAAQAEQPVKLQWLPLLACWLASPPQASTRPGAAAPEAAHASSTSVQQQLKGQASPAVDQQQTRGSTGNRDRGGSPRSPAMRQPSNKQSRDGLPGASPAMSTKGVPGSKDSDKSSSTMIVQDFNLDQHAEQAFQLQEAAMRAGYAAAALPLWEQFLWRFSSFQAQLEDIVPCSAISRHLAELAHLYEATSPIIANIYVLIASVSPESLPQGSTGKGLDFIRSNVEAQRALMQLHPCKLMTLVQSTAPAPAATGNGQTGINGRPGRADLSQPEGEAVPAQQRHGAVTDHARLRKPAPEASAYQDINRAQEELLAECANAAAHVAAWANRKGKRAADNPVPQEATQSDPDSNGEAIGSGAADHGKAGLALRLKSPRHSSGREGDVPESISQAQARLWEGLSTLSEHLDVLHGTLRELVVRRFRETDMAAIEAGRFGELERLPADEVPDYQEQWQRNREAAFSAAMEFSKGADIAEAARNLYLMEVVMADGQIRSEDSAALHERDTDSHRCQLLTVLGETVLDESMPAAGVPFCMAIFQQAAPCVLGPSPAAKAEVTQRLMSALAPRGEGASRPKEALTLLNHALGSDSLLVQGRLQEYCACLSAVLSGCASLQAELASSLLMCFDMRGLCVAMMQARPAATDQVDMQAHLQGSRGKSAPSMAAMQLLDVSLKTAAVPGGTAAAVRLLEGIAAAGGVAAYLNACLAVTLSYGSADARQQGLAWLTGLQLDDAPLPALTEAISQVTAALNEAESAQHEIPYAFIQHLIQAPSALEALHQSLKTGSGASNKERILHPDGIWTAAVGGLAPTSAASAASSRAPDIQPGPSVLLLPVQSGKDAAASIEQLIGACLQSILRRFGSGLDGHSIAEELTQLLALLMEPVGSNLWLVDWLWHLYKESLQPFLMLAGPASDGLAVMRFREMWGCLPWHQATFHSSSSEGLADLGAYLLAPDHGAMDLLHALPWDSILAALAPAVRPGASLDGQPQQWATQLALLALQCMVLLPQSQLPSWLLDLAHPLSEQSGGSVKLRLPRVIAEADSAALQDILCAEVEGIPYLLQPLVDIPMHVKGDPSIQLQSITSMLSSAAHLSGKPEVAALASRVQQGLLFKSVGRAFIDGRTHAEADSSRTSSAAEVRECWHLSAESHSLLVMDSLLPLAALHAAAVVAAPGLSRQSQHRAAPDQEVGTLLSTASQSARWSAPQLSALVNRLQDSHRSSSASAAEHSQPGRPERARPPSRLASGSMAQPEHRREGEPAPGKSQGPGCIPAAAPAHALLSCLTAEARTFLTSDPVPFANAEAPLQDAASRVPSAADGRSREAAAAEAASRLHEEHQRGAGTAVKQGAGALLDRARSVTRQLQMKGRNSSELKRQRFMRAEAVASVRDIQVHIAGLIDDACQHGSCELAMSLLRVGCTMPALRRLPLGSALLESLVGSIISEQHAPASEDALRRTASGEHHPGRRSSYTEQALAAAIETPVPPVTGEEHRPGSTAGQLLQCLGGLGSEAVLQVCADASALQSPLLQAVASEKARRLVAEEEQASWRHSVSEVLRAAALAEAQPEHPRHAAAVWLAALLWLEDARWRKLRSGGAPTDALEALLDALSRRVLLLSLPAPEDTAPIRPVATAPGSSGQTKPPCMDAGTPGHEGKSSSLSRFTQKVSGMVPSFRSDSTGVSSADGQPDRIDDGQAVQPRSKTLAKFRGKLFGNKNKLPPGTVDIPPSAFDYGSSMSMQQAPGSRLETIPSDDCDDSFQQGYSSSQDSPKAAGQEAGLRGLSVRTASRAFSEEGRPPSKQEHTSSARDTASKLALDVKRALRIGRRAEIAAAEAAAEAAEEEEAAEAAADVVIRLGLAAFAVSAYIKTVLCPSMSSYTPRMSSASLAADLAGSGGALASVLLHRQSASLSSLPGHSQGGTPRMMGTPQLGTPTTSLDKLQRDDMLMHELDQVLETRAELDSLEELANCPMVARRAEKYSAFFAAAPEMLQSTRSVADFERRLVELLFPEATYLHCLAIAH